MADQRQGAGIIGFQQTYAWDDLMDGLVTQANKECRQKPCNTKLCPSLTRDTDVFKVVLDSVMCQEARL